MDPNELIIPVYLNQRIVFDFIAMIENGMSMITRAIKFEEAHKFDKETMDAKFGLGQALSSLLRIAVRGEKEVAKEECQREQKEQERIHTPASLLQKLRSILIEKGVLKNEDKIKFPEVWDIVEFSAFFRLNPILEKLAKDQDKISIIKDLSEIKNGKNQSNFQKNDKNKETDRKNTPDLAKKMIEAIKENLSKDNNLDIVGYVSTWECESVINLEKQYLNDPEMSDILEGKFRVLGKVIRVIQDNSKSINLIRNSRFAKAGISLPMFKDFDIEVKGPAIQVIPIGIYA